MIPLSSLCKLNPKILYDMVHGHQSIPLSESKRAFKINTPLSPQPHIYRDEQVKKSKEYYASLRITIMNNLESYPPILRHLGHEDHYQSPNLDLDDLDDKRSIDPAQDLPDLVPVIDLNCLGHDMEKLEDACKDWGLFRLVNHGVPLTLMKQLQDQAKELFSMPYESKHASCNGSPVTYFWGTPALTPSGTALARGPKNIDWVEGFDVPLARISQFQPQLPSLESMRLLLIEYETHLSRIATTLFNAMMKNILKKPTPDSSPSSNYLSEKTGIVRVYRYPPHCSSCSDNNNNNNVIGNWGMEAHTDSSVLSILNQDDQVSGLQVLKYDNNNNKNDDDKWLTVKPIPNTLIVNLGDMMQAISNDRYKSVSHRVKVNKERERISICYFVFPVEDFLIESSQYKPFTYNEFRAQVQQDVKALGYKVGLARFKNNNNDEDS